jgi:hypothetical protein
LYEATGTEYVQMGNPGTSPSRPLTVQCHGLVAALNVTSTLCGVDPYANGYYLYVMPVFLALTIIIVMLRLTARLVRQLNFWWDDMLAVCSLAGCIAFTSSTLSQKPLGLGKQIWSVPQENITPFLYLAYVHFPIYAATLLCIRVCIILFCIRLFGRTKLLLGALILQFIISTPFIIAVCLVCIPPKTFWEDWDDSSPEPKQCFDFKASVFAGAGVSTILDIGIMLLVVPYLRKLNIDLKKKIQISAMFFLGIITTAVSIARIPYIPYIASATNPTVDLVPMAVWSALELDIGLICACLPSLRTLFLHVMSYSHQNPNRPRTTSDRARAKRMSEGLTDTMTWGTGNEEYIQLQGMNDSAKQVPKFSLTTTVTANA